MNIMGWFEVLDDFGLHIYTVSRIGKRGRYYFTQRTLIDNHRLRYNENTGCVEELLGCGKWDVYSSYVYQTRFIPDTEAETPSRPGNRPVEWPT